MRFARNAKGAGPRIPTRLVSDPSTVRHVRATSCAPSSVPPRARLPPRDASFAVSEARTRAPSSACREPRVGWVQVETGRNPPTMAMVDPWRTPRGHPMQGKARGS
eukprot:scaffold616_cov306-Pavlova_lutheri.AAC.37